MRRLVLISAALAAVAIAAPDFVQTVLLSPETADGYTGVAAGSGTGSPGSRTLVLKAGSNGHYYTTAWINGRAVDALIDTGASSIALPLKVAQSAGVNPGASRFTAPTHTANGVVNAAPVTLREIRLGGIRLTNVQAMVLPEGALGITLVGMSALAKLSKVDIRNDTMRLVQ